MPTSEIEKLERRYAENPHGLTFAPLAEVHRKGGDLVRALELLTAGLELHPNYIPASIVLGRCHQDLGDLAAAEAAFTHVLRLDDENVIALKSLADISQHLERFEEAEGWLQRLVSVDRSNEDAREQLRRVEAELQSRSATPHATSEPGEDSGVGDAPAALEMIDLSTEAETFSEEPGTAPEQLPVDIEALEPAPVEEAAPAAELAGEEIQHAGSAGHAPEEPQSLEALAPEGFEENPEPEEKTAEPLPGLISAEFQPPLQSTGGLDVETSEEVVLEGSGNPQFRVPDASEELREASAQQSSMPAAEADARDSVTAGMAPTEAQADADVTVAGKMADAAGPPKRSYLARDTEGRSVAAFFRELLVARPPSEPDSADRAPGAGGEAANLAENRNGAPAEIGRDEEIVPVPPAVPPAEDKADAVVSFDDFFSPEPDGSSSTRQRRSDPGKDDLDQFQSWLQNLKR